MTTRWFLTVCFNIYIYSSRWWLNESTYHIDLRWFHVWLPITARAWSICGVGRTFLLCIFLLFLYFSFMSTNWTHTLFVTICYIIISAFYFFLPMWWIKDLYIYRCLKSIYHISGHVMAQLSKGHPSSHKRTPPLHLSTLPPSLRQILNSSQEIKLKIVRTEFFKTFWIVHVYSVSPWSTAHVYRGLDGGRGWGGGRSTVLISVDEFGH